MAKIIIDYRTKMQAISPVVNFKFKHPERLKPKNKGKITRIYNLIGREIGYPIKVFKIKNKGDRERALKAFNPRWAHLPWIKNPAIQATNNENTTLIFKGKKRIPQLINKKAGRGGAEIDEFIFTKKEITTKDFTRLKTWLNKENLKKGIKRGKMVTKDGDIYTNPNVGGTVDPTDFESFSQRLNAMLDEYSESISRWLLAVQVVRFK